MNVALVCKMFAGWLKFSETETNNLILAGLLHDIGKMLIPKSILTKPTKLTDEEFQTMKNHSQLGYSILKNQNADSHICLAALQHHERCDGSGYPLGLTAAQIDSYAKIVAIADVYDALTASRVYRGPVCPLEAIGIFQTEGLTKYDPKYLMCFLDGIMNAYQNCTVRLSTGVIGRIVMMQRNSLDRPVVQISDDQFIDLNKTPGVTVAEII
jgi:HD-GYP domain-containing protein (c-di-GMP phosphodiesterase class II)